MLDVLPTYDYLVITALVFTVGFALLALVWLTTAFLERGHWLTMLGIVATISLTHAVLFSVSEGISDNFGDLPARSRPADPDRPTLPAIMRRSDTK